MEFRMPPGLAGVHELDSNPMTDSCIERRVAKQHSIMYLMSRKLLSNQAFMAKKLLKNASALHDIRLV
jgi:hypothetical protein